MRRFLFLGLCLIVLGAIPALGCDSDITPVSQEGSRSIAREYVLASATFTFDGMEETLELVSEETLRCPYCWEFVFEFDSGHAGYGDRTGQVLAQVITPHTARVATDRGEVVSAVLDGKWDMIEQELISDNAE